MSVKGKRTGKFVQGLRALYADSVASGATEEQAAASVVYVLDSPAARRAGLAVDFIEPKVRVVKSTREDRTENRYPARVKGVPYPKRRGRSPAESFLVRGLKYTTTYSRGEAVRASIGNLTARGESPRAALSALAIKVLNGPRAEVLG